MQKKERTVGYFDLNTDDLSGEETQVYQLAAASVRSAYAPYSKFKVGSAVLLGNGEMVTGTNQENGAYPSGLCAERIAVFAAKSRFPDETIEAIAIVAEPSADQEMDMLSPCGACRQVLNEYHQNQGKPFPIILGTMEQDRIVKFESIEELLPFSFSVKGLGSN